MKNQSNQEIIYSLNIEDIQTVAQQELERELTLEEIDKIRDSIADRFNWYDTVADTIYQHSEEKNSG
jgi:hypothetical protein